MCSYGVNIFPPVANNTNLQNCEFVLFFARDYFGTCVKMVIKSPKPPKQIACMTKRTDKGKFMK